MKAEPRDLSAIIAGVELESVRLSEVSANSLVRSVGDVAPVNMEIKWGALFAERCEGGFYVSAPMDVDVRSQKAPNKTVLLIRLRFELKYQLDPTVVASDDGLRAFAAVNGSFNAWPYCRAFVQSLSAQMDVPPLTIPVFRVNEKFGQAAVEKPRSRATSSAARRALSARKVT